MKPTIKIFVVVEELSTEVVSGGIIGGGVVISKAFLSQDKAVRWCSEENARRAVWRSDNGWYHAPVKVMEIDISE